MIVVRGGNSLIDVHLPPSPHPESLPLRVGATRLDRESAAETVRRSGDVIHKHPILRRCSVSRCPVRLQAILVRPSVRSPVPAISAFLCVLPRIHHESSNSLARLEPTLSRGQVECCARSLEPPPIVATERQCTPDRTTALRSVYQSFQLLR
ncbi:hypothetical protein ELS17_02680 [Natrinema altunense]|uniref:Uncharacterized protein n=1 Tax=Natrinema altunense TaxID=222984 RepID=A0A482XXI4_9EURY|nr:hypothetical protein ELS17_02680 [Natrinema altunense]